MAEQDPREYRGGVKEPSDTKGGEDTAADNEGIVPRDMIDDPGAAAAGSRPVPGAERSRAGRGHGQQRPE